LNKGNFTEFAMLNCVEVEVVWVKSQVMVVKLEVVWVEVVVAGILVLLTE